MSCMKREETSLQPFDRMRRRWYFDDVQPDEDERVIDVCHPRTSALRAW
jgi:hypothetical protein